jgi:tetratricopeptide (TPR) repeat protein
VILASRIDRLDPPDKELLQTAAVIGTDVPLALVLALVQGVEDDVRRGLVRLQAAEFLYESGLFPEVEYTFKHALTHEVAYESLLHQRRCRLHAGVVEAIERLHAGRLAEHVEQLAHHAFRGELWAKAITYTRQAGVNANARSANHEAVAFLQQALAAVKHLPRSPRTTEVEIDLRFELRAALQPLGHLDQLLDNLRSAEILAAELDDPRLTGRVLAYQTEHLRLIGDHARALDTGHRAVAIADALGDLALILPARTWLGQVLQARGDYQQAAELFRALLDRLIGDLRLERFGLIQLPAVHVRTCLAFCLAELGTFHEGIVYAEEAVRIAESVDHPRALAVASAGLGSLYVRQGDLQRAVPVLERCLALVRTGEIRLWMPSVTAALGLTYALSGRVAEALPLLDDAVARASDMGLRVGRAFLIATLARAHLLAGGIDEARRLAAEALELARNHGEKGQEALALLLCGDVALQSRPLEADRAETHWREALGRARELGMRPLVAHCHLGLGTLYRRTRQCEKASEHLATATTMYHEMDMLFWLDQAEAETRVLV